jgi:hypothetical protein
MIQELVFSFKEFSLLKTSQELSSNKAHKLKIILLFIFFILKFNLKNKYIIKINKYKKINKKIIKFKKLMIF